ncbi:universal stress protein [Maribacter sp. ACAM166]|uniref:universal stress protein n=1 Tax=Maribacter sp. ACAM166 TaxID=2508996 RepID=UPI0010FDFD89|nr:universal stress protein [Maribacter sp. ACAM166]TLP71980.1 universal stress protein [Maribacter sp. ACAM166]
MKKIILPTDFSKNAQKAIDFALLLFKNERCTFYLLHAYHDAPSSSKDKKSTKEDLNQLVHTLEVQNNNKKHHFKGVLETDSVLNLTNRTQINEGVNYVFIGTKGSSALREIFVGSNTLDLIKYIHNCPIVVIPAAYKYTGLKEIVLATDFKHTFMTMELVPLIQITFFWEATLNVVHLKTEETLSDTQKSNKELLRKALENTKHQFFEIELKDTVANTLYQIEKANKNIGMMAILKTNHGFFQKLTHENIIKNITFKTEIPLMVLPQIE